MALEEKTDEHLVDGCESKVWLLGDVSDGHWQFRAASDARLIRGLVALLLARVNGLTAQDLHQVDLPEWFNQLGLSRQLSPSRSNGLNAVLQRMRQLARSEEHTSELQSPDTISYAVFCLKNR